MQTSFRTAAVKLCRRDVLEGTSKVSAGQPAEALPAPCVQVIRPSGEVGKEITMGVFVRDIFLDQVRAGDLLYVFRSVTGFQYDAGSRGTLWLIFPKLNRSFTMQLPSAGAYTTRHRRAYSPACAGLAQVVGGPREPCGGVYFGKSWEAS